ncbi:MAG TPA: glutamate synthase, partial [Euryarchaeota archaeon]|nr:glutamate synthase [Euryarchaeota archaeon]
VLDRFVTDNGLEEVDAAKAEDEFVYQNSYRLNNEFYAALGNKKAFVLSHGKNLMVFKIVGYAEEAMHYYGLENLRAHVWVGHQRYPTKGKVWHPAGAHPFIGLHEALVHNGDFANYYSVEQYLAQRNIRPQFLTDTEVSVLLFDFLRRVCEYPLEYVIEALAPTTERDFAMLPNEKQAIYRRIQISHLHGSPDGPWFFIIARNDPLEEAFRLIGITDTSMLRPQVFALQRGKASIGLIASEKQAIDAALASLANEDDRFWPRADKYWNARGGSHTDGGSFIFSLIKDNDGFKLECRDKFGVEISDSELSKPVIDTGIKRILSGSGIPSALTPSQEDIRTALSSLAPAEAADRIIGLADGLKNDDEIQHAIDVLTSLIHDRFELGPLKKAFVAEVAEQALYKLFDSLPRIRDSSPLRFRRLTVEDMGAMLPPTRDVTTLLIDAKGFDPEGDRGLSRALLSAYGLGWRDIHVYRMCGQRFIGCGCGKRSESLRINVYGTSGDYLASGIDGAEVLVHGSAQDQVAQIFNRGKLVIYGDVGQTFMYGAKGGEAYILGNTAGRPLINAVGKPRVIMNGTCLDYLAESFMAGDPMSGGGFVILNGLAIDGDGRITEQETPYPGGNLFSLASGGAIYVRDPAKKLTEDLLNGGQFAPFTMFDWDLIEPYLLENERLFGISVEKHILTHEGKRLEPTRVFRKVKAVPVVALAPTGT